MFPILRRHWMLWAVWIGVASVLLFANPWIPFGWAELAACVGPLLIAVDRRIRREGLLASGLLGIALLAVLDSTAVSVVRLLVDALVFVGAVLLGARAVDDQIELEAIAGHLALGPDPVRAYFDFRRSVEREIGRARRHERSFVVLSMAPAGRPAAPEAERPGPGRVAERITEARRMLELRDLLAEEVHLYAEIVATEKRVLCLIPEVEEAAIPALERRLRAASHERLGLEVDSGIARFPQDALAVDDLIEVADATCRLPKLGSVPAASAADRGDGDGALLRDAES